MVINNQQYKNLCAQNLFILIYFLTLMQLKLGGIIALFIGIIIFIFVVAMLAIAGSIFFLAVPVLLAAGIIMYIVRKIIPRKIKKQTKNDLDVEFKVKE